MTQFASTIQEHPGAQPRILHGAGAGRGNGQRPPVCISYPQPGGSRQRQRRRIRSRIDQMLRALDMPRCSAARTLWEQSGSMPAQASSSEGGAAC